MSSWQKRIDTKVSRTAKLTCLSRAMSFYEQNIFLKSSDYIAPMILPPFFKTLLKSNILRNIFKKLFFHYGIYEYVIARTNYIDYIFKDLKSGFDQILILGAGFDSRAIRFYDNLKNATVYELDSPKTQKAKINQFRKLNIEFPPNLKFISIDFEKETLNQKLERNGFRKNKICLFLLEGLTMYIDPQSLDNIFSLIKEYSAKGSLIIFDYIYTSVLKGEEYNYGAKGINELVGKHGEKWVFGIEKGQIEYFLNNYEFELIDESDCVKLVERFFKDPNENKTYKINGAHSIATARKK